MPLLDKEQLKNHVEYIIEYNDLQITASGVCDELKYYKSLYAQEWQRRK